MKTGPGNKPGVSALLIYPPVAKPCEPPAGIAKLSGTLKSHGIECRVLDASLEGLLHQMGVAVRADDLWTSRAIRNRSRNLASIRDGSTYENIDRYKRAVLEMDRLLEVSDATGLARIGLANFQHRVLSPLRSNDLLRAAERPEENPFHPYFHRRLQELLEAGQPDLIGFSVNFLSQALTAFAMIGYLRRECPSARIVLGGGLITSWMRRPGWRNPFSGLVESLVAGPGEQALLSLAGIGNDSKDESAPDYSALPFHEYLSPGVVLPYSASSGCYWNRCSFCPERAEGNPYLPIPASRVLRELDQLTAKMHPSLIHFLDNALSPALMTALTKNPPGAPWYGFSRISRHLADLDFCVALKRSGCVMLKLGLESGDQGVVEREGKGVDLEMASRVLGTLKKAGISTYAYLLFGTPSETIIEARKTLDFTAKHAGYIDFLNLAIFNMPIHGPETEGLQTAVHYEGDLSLYTGFTHPLGWDRSLVRQFLDKEFKRHPAIAAILRKDPPHFTSNHAPFLSLHAENRKRG